MKKSLVLFVILLNILVFVALNRDYLENKAYELTGGKGIRIDTSALNPFTDASDTIYEPNEDIFGGDEYQYYYQCLSEDDKLIYRQIYAIFKDIQTNVALSTTDINKATEIQQLVILDNPSLFYIDSSEYTKTTDTNGNTLKIEFSAIPSMSEIEIDSASTSIDSFITGFSYHVSDTMTDYEKAVAAYSYIINNTDYVLDSPHNQNIYSVVLGQSVCQGYALMFKYLCDQMNIPCIMVTGQDKSEPHAWDLVYIDEAWCYVDPTFGDNNYLNSDISYSWFGMPTSLVKENRTINNLDYLPTDDTINNDYYYRNGWYFDSYNLSQVQDLAMMGGIFSFKYSSLEAYNTAVNALFTQNDVQHLIVGKNGAKISYITDEESRTIYIKIEENQQ